MNIIPKAKTYKEMGSIHISDQFSCDEKLFFCQKSFLRIVYKIYGVSLKNGDDGIKVCYDDFLSENEYRIEGNTVYASDVEGARYGLATMLQLMEKEDTGFLLRNVSVSQKPEKEFRAFMSDLGRQWHPFETLLGYVDLCYLNKIKYLQLHFTDNSLWTLKIDAFPKLGKKESSYTKKEIEYLVEYAHEAGVELIPEFEGIGHSKALIETYPEFFGNEYQDEIEDIQAVTGIDKGKVDNIMCIGKPDIFINIQKMLTEIAEIFKYSKYIHVGCDEAKHENWAKCKHCAKYMQDNNIATTKELYSHFVKKIVDICLEIGKTPIVWEGFPKEGTENISRECVVVAWESYYQLAPELLEAGFKIINASWKPMYIVQPHRKDKLWSVTGEDWNVCKWMNFHEKSPASKTPIVVENSEKVLGGMLCQWECCLEEERERVILNMPMLSDRTFNVTDFYSDAEFNAAKQKIVEMSEKLI